MGVFGTLKWIPVFLTLVSSASALDCYKCADMDVVVYEPQSENDLVIHLKPSLRDFRCRRPGDSVSTSNNYQTNWNTDQNYQSPTGPLYPLTCPAPVPGSKKVTRCGAWQGQVHATVFGDRPITFRAFSFGCVNVSPNLEIGCHRRDMNDEEDRKHFQDILYNKFQNNINVNRFDGYLCFCTDKDCQRTNSASHPYVVTNLSVLMSVLVALLLF